jgi:hypothetical protein
VRDARANHGRRTGQLGETKRDGGAVLCAVMPDLLDTIRQEIDSRLEELRPLAREASDLQRALDALNGVPAAPTPELAAHVGSPVSPRRRGVPAWRERTFAGASWST